MRRMRTCGRKRCVTNIWPTWSPRTPTRRGKVRVNAVLSATDDFYDAFGITEHDAMYVAPEDRPHIW